MHDEIHYYYQLHYFTFKYHLEHFKLNHNKNYLNNVYLACGASMAEDIKTTQKDTLLFE